MRVYVQEYVVMSPLERIVYGCVTRRICKVGCVVAVIVINDYLS